MEWIQDRMNRGRNDNAADRKDEDASSAEQELDRARLVVERGWRLFRQGHSVYISRLESQVICRTVEGNLTEAGCSYGASGGTEAQTRLCSPEEAPWCDGPSACICHPGQTQREAGIPSAHGEP